MTNQSTSCTVK